MRSIQKAKYLGDFVLNPHRFESLDAKLSALKTEEYTRLYFFFLDIPEERIGIQERPFREVAMRFGRLSNRTSPGTSGEERKDRAPLYRKAADGFRKHLTIRPSHCWPRCSLFRCLSNQVA